MLRGQGLEAVLRGQGVYALEPGVTLKELPLGALEVACEPPPDTFAAHRVFSVRVDSAFGLKQVERDIHCFTLPGEHAQELCEELRRSALLKERRAMMAERLVYIPPGPGADVGVVKSNVGGFQSYHDLFDASEDSESETESEPDTWDKLLAVVQRAHAIGKLGERELAREDVYAWLNINRPGDVNKLHAHDSSEHWSGCFYATSSRRQGEDDGFDGGSLGLRATVEGEECGYYRIHPRAGEMWLFRGDVLHCVEAHHVEGIGQTHEEGYELPDECKRISVAFNIDYGGERGLDELSTEAGSEE